MTNRPAGSGFVTEGRLPTLALPRWQPNTAYMAGQYVLNPLGQVVSAKSDFTSGTSYVASNWTVSAGLSGGGPNTSDLGYDLLLLLGQSNMAGSNSDYNLRTDPVDSRVFSFDYLGTYARSIVNAQDPLQHQKNNDGAGPGFTLGRWYAQGIPTNRRVLLIPGAAGATALTPTSGETWNSAVRGSLYDNALLQTQQALIAAGPNARLVGAFWVQGEFDDGVAAATYRTALDALITRLRSDLNLPNLPFIIGGMVPENISDKTGLQAIAAVHTDTPNRITGTAYVPGPSGFIKGGTDRVHYSAAGQRIQGRRMAAQLLGVALPPLPAADTTAPTAPTNLAAGTVTTTTVPLTWTASTDNVAVTGYRVRRGGTVVATTTSTSYTDTGLTAGTAYSYTVTAIDAAGNESTTSNTVSATTTASSDTTAPTTPTNLAAGAPTSSTVPLTWTASTDNVGVTGYRIRRGGTVVGTSTTTSYTDTGLTAGTAYSYTVTAYDAAGNESAQSTSASATTAAASGNPDVGPTLSSYSTPSPAYGAGKFGNGLTDGFLRNAATLAGVRSIEVWVKPTSAATMVAAGVDGRWIGVGSSNTSMGYEWNGGGAQFPSGSVNLRDGSFHHLAVCVDATGGLKAFIDGVVVGTSTGVTAAMDVTNLGIKGMNKNATAPEFSFVGVVDEVRLSSVARYTAAFTPPTTAFTTDANTLALYHLEA